MKKVHIVLIPALFILTAQAFSATATDTITETITETMDASATFTEAETITDTPDWSPTFTPTAQDTETSTVTATPSETGAQTVTETENVTPTETGIETFTVTETGTPAETANETPADSATATNTEDITPADTPALTPTPTETAAQGCVNFLIDRSAVPAMVFMKKLTVKVNVGDCDYCTVYVDGVFVPSYYNSTAKICMFTATGDNVQIMRVNYAGGATNTITKAALFEDKKWAYSLTLDDGRTSQFTNAYPILDSYGYRAGIAMNTSGMQPVANGWSMSWASADILRAKGWSFFDHNYSHQNATCANISTETVPVKNAIDARWPGYFCTHFVYPYLDTSNWTCIRDSGLFLSAENWQGANYADVLPASPYLLNRNGIYGTNVPSFNAYADSAANDARPRWLINFTHDVTGSPDQYSTDIPSFTAHIAYIYNTYGEGGLNNMWFAPTDEVMQYILTREHSVLSYTGEGPCSGVTPATPSPSRTLTPYCSPTITRTVTVTRTITMTRTITATRTITLTATATPTLTPYTQTEQTAIFPNPAKTSITVRFKDGMGAAKAGILIYTHGFRLIRSITRDANAQNTYSINTSNIANGMYFIVARLIKDDREVYRKAMPVLVIK